MLSQILGGIGIFLLGMILMTDGLKSVAGDALRALLARFTRGPLSALATGTVVTAIVQSSSATTLTTIGFVSAGLLTFPQAIGVIFGANVGTTSTGWIVSTLGLRVSMSVVAMPLVGVGALVRLLGRDRIAAAGTALAGLGLVFVGIDVLQEGMQGLAEHISPESFPAGLGGRFLLVLAGAAMTVVMQSSSAAAATTLAALDAGTIDLERAAALVIGQNLGTTVTAGIAAIGASVAARRTAMAHVLFNALTGLLAFAVLPLFVAIVDALTESLGGVDDAMSLAAFHTAFNVLGVAIFFPFIARYAAFIERIVPERGPRLTRHLDRSVARVPAVAVDAAQRTLREVALVASHTARRVLAGDPKGRHDLDALSGALDETRRFLATVRSSAESAAEHARHLSVLHAVDHLERLVTALRERAPSELAARSPELAAMRASIRVQLDAADHLFAGDAAEDPLPAVMDGSGAIAEVRRVERPVLLERTARGELPPERALALLESMRWVDRLGYHLARVAHHLRPGGAPVPAEHTAPAEP